MYDNKRNQGPDLLEMFLDHLNEDLDDMDTEAEVLEALEAFRANPRKDFELWWSEWDRGNVRPDFALDPTGDDPFDQQLIERQYHNRLAQLPKAKLMRELSESLSPSTTDAELPAVVKV